MIETIESKINGIREVLLREMASSFDYEVLVGHPDMSPFERLMAAALHVASWRSGCFNQPAIGHGSIFTIDVLRGWQERSLPEASLSIFHEVPIGKYRADFVVMYWDKETKRLVVIECDGHEFHEKTKQQVERDKERDRFFQTLGLVVLRFSGSEIWRDPTRCGKLAIDTALYHGDPHIFSTREK